MKNDDVSYQTLLKLSDSQTLLSMNILLLMLGSLLGRPSYLKLCKQLSNTAPPSPPLPTTVSASKEAIHTCFLNTLFHQNQTCQIFQKSWNQLSPSLIKFKIIYNRSSLFNFQKDFMRLEKKEQNKCNHSAQPQKRMAGGADRLAHLPPSPLLALRLSRALALACCVERVSYMEELSSL